jgi:hypothetical protein
MLLVLLSFSAAADTGSIRHEVEVFLSSGIGTIVSVVLLLLFLLWLLLPLAVFGLKSKLRRLTSELRESNRMLTDIMESNKLLADSSNAGEITAHINETNKILADIREELSVLNEEDASGASAAESGATVREEDSSAYYDEIKYEP